MPLLEVQHLQKVYTSRFGGRQVEALQNVNFSVEPGEYVAIMGESGSGKTTLLNILAALDRPTAGEVFLNGKALSDVRERDLAAFRRSHLGFVFQDFNLLDILLPAGQHLPAPGAGGTALRGNGAKAEAPGRAAGHRRHPEQVPL